MNIYGPILPLQLDSRNLVDIVRAIQTRVNIESDNTLTDFTPASPLAAISEGQAFAHAELLYYLNNLPEAFSIQWFRQLGVQRIIGSRSLATLTFYPELGYGGTILIPQNTRFITDSGLAFLLTNQVVLDANSLSATGVVRSERWGSVYNVGEGQINRVNKKILGLNRVTNLTPAVGGRDVETINEMKTRVFELLSRRNLTTPSDFENEIKLVAPEAQIIKALTYEERFNFISQDVGGVFIVAGDKDGRALSEESQQVVTKSFKDRVVMGTNVSIIPPNVIPIDLVLDIFYNPETLSVSLDEAARSVFSSLSSYFDPISLGLGGGIQYQEVVKRLYSDNQDVITAINNLYIKLMILDEENIEGVCAGFSGDIAETEDECLYNYLSVVDSSNQSYVNNDPVVSYKLWRCSISLTSNKTPTSLTFTYKDLYTP